MDKHGTCCGSLGSPEPFAVARRGSPLGLIGGEGTEVDLRKQLYEKVESAGGNGWLVVVGDSLVVTCRHHDSNTKMLYRCL